MLILDKICPVCHLLNEDDGHCFLKCKMVKAVWQSAQQIYVYQMQMQHLKENNLELQLMYYFTSGWFSFF